MIIYNKTNNSDFIRFKKGQKRCGCSYSKCFQIQCVHELVKYGTLKPDYFSKRWYRRDGYTKSMVIGNYKNPLTCDVIPMSMNEYLPNDIGIIESLDSNLDENEEFNKSGISTDISSMNYTSKCRTPTRLNHTDYSNISNRLFNACERNKKYATFVNGMMLHMLNIVEKEDRSILLADNYNENMSKHFPNLIDNYKQLFGTDNNDVFLDNIEAPLKTINTHFATNNRLKTTREKKIQQLKKRKNEITQCYGTIKNSTIQNRTFAKRSCTFCKVSDGHTVSNCKLKMKYGKCVDCILLMEIILSKAPYKIIDPDQANNVIYDLDSKLINHVLIHTVQTKIETINCRPTKEDLIIEVTCLGKNGTELPGYTRSLIHCPQIFNYLHKIKGSKHHYVFSNIDKECIGSEYQKNEYCITVPNNSNCQTPLSSQPLYSANNHVHQQATLPYYGPNIGIHFPFQQNAMNSIQGNTSHYMNFYNPFVPMMIPRTPCFTTNNTLNSNVNETIKAGTDINGPTLV